MLCRQASSPDILIMKQKQFLFSSTRDESAYGLHTRWSKCSSSPTLELKIFGCRRRKSNGAGPKDRAADGTPPKQGGTLHPASHTSESTLQAQLQSQHCRTLTPEFLGGRVPNTTFLRRGRDWPQSVTAHTAPGFLLKPWETCS